MNILDVVICELLVYILFYDVIFVMGYRKKLLVSFYNREKIKEMKCEE